MKKKHYNFPYIQKLTNRVCDASLTNNNYNFTYYNRYEVNVKSGTTDFMNITIKDKTLNCKTIADIDFDYANMFVTFNEILNERLRWQLMDAFQYLCQYTKEYRQLHGFRTAITFMFKK
jgi:hypothetical protein